MEISNERSIDVSSTFREWNRIDDTPKMSELEIPRERSFEMSRSLNRSNC